MARGRGSDGMTAALARGHGGVAWSERNALLMVVGVHIALLIQVVISTSVGIGGALGTGNPLIVTPLALAAFAIQLRHSLAVARGEAPRNAIWTTLALGVLVYLPLHWFGWAWAGMQAYLMASAAMFFRGWGAVVAVALPIVGTD